MAIEKVEKSQKVELTKEALFSFIGAGVAAVLALLFGWFAFSNWKAKTALVDGFQAYESNRLGEAKRALQDAASWKPEHVGVKQVLAKIACDAGGSELSVAEDNYKKIRALGVDGSTEKVGMGVLWLKRAEKATAPKEVQEFIGKAQAEFRGANDIPEGEIGLGHCDLLLGSKLGDAKKLGEARVKFENIRKSLGNHATAAKISRDGLIDYYAGLGRVLSVSDKPEELKEAREAFQSCVQIARRWEVARANIELIEARRWSLWKGSAVELAAADPETAQLRKVLGSYWKDSRDSGLTAAHRLPWMAFSVSYAQAQSRAGNSAGAASIFQELRTSSHYAELPEPLLAEARFRCELAMKDGLKASEQDNLVRDAIGVFDPLLKRLPAPTDEATKDRKARVLNAHAVLKFYQGLPGYKAAQEFLGEALKLYPDDYLYNRNLLIVMKRNKALPAAIAPVLEKAKAAATGPHAEDFEKVQKVLEEK